MKNDSEGVRRTALAVLGDGRAPAWPQLVFLLPFAALVALLSLLTPDQLVSRNFLLGVALVLIASVATFAVPWERFPSGAVMVLPLLDLAAVGAIRLTPGLSASATLGVLPAMWMGLIYRRRGVAIATVASLVVMTIPALVYVGANLDGYARAVVHPLLVFVTAASMALTAREWSAQRTDLEQQGQQLAGALATLRSHRQVNEAIVRSVDVGLLTLGPDGLYVSTNPQLDHFLDIAFPDGHRGWAGQLGAVYAEDNKTLLTEQEMPSIRARNGEPFTGYTIWIGSDPDRRRAHSVSSRPMFDENGDFEGAVLAYHDVTDLMRALHVKDEFVASVSHELRTPLTSIMGYLELAIEHGDDLPDEVNGYLGVAIRNAERLLLLVSDLLTTAQAEAGPMHLFPRPTDLAALVRACVADVSHRAHDAGVTMHEVISSVTPLMADAHRLEQVVGNLLSNSIKYTPAGGEVHVNLAQTADETALTIRDTGIGIAAGEQTHLFTKFFRARNADERAIPGVGLGLVITKAIVEAHGGTVDLRSTEGVGTTVCVRLPLRSAADVSS